MWGVDNVTNQFKVIRKIPGANPREFLSLAPDTGAPNFWADLPDTSPPGTLCGSFLLSPYAIPGAAIAINLLPDTVVPCKGQIPGMDAAQIFDKIQQVNDGLKRLACPWKGTFGGALDGIPCLLDSLNPGVIADVIRDAKTKLGIPWGCPSGYKPVMTGFAPPVSMTFSCAKK